MQHRAILFALGAFALAWGAGAFAASPSTSAGDAPAAAVRADDDVPPKDDEKKNEVTVWVLDASGKG